MSITTNLGKYLGVPLLNQRMNTETYAHLVNKDNKKLSSWKVDALSLIGGLLFLRLP